MSRTSTEGAKELIPQVSAGLIGLETAVRAFVDSIGYVFGVESGSEARRVGNVHVIHHLNDVMHPYPREFYFRREFIAMRGYVPDVVASVRQALRSPTEEHVLYVFAEDSNLNTRDYELLGYEHAWSSGLMAVAIDEARTPLARGYFRISELIDLEGVEAYQQLGGAEGVTRTLNDSQIHSFVSYDIDGEPLGRSQLVTRVDGFAYVSGMFTVPDRRGEGIGSGLMNAMHKRARREGAEFCILIPSRMATEINFYPRFGYQIAAPHVVLVPKLDI